MTFLVSVIFAIVSGGIRTAEGVGKPRLVSRVGNYSKPKVLRSE